MTDHATDVQEIADRIDRFLQSLHRDQGFAFDAIAAGAHAQIVAMLATAYGGPAAAGMCERAADTVRPLPSMRAYALAIAPPAGHA